MDLKLTRIDACRIHHLAGLVRKKVEYPEMLSESEWTMAIVKDLVDCETDYGIEQCAALIPKHLWPKINAAINSIASQTAPSHTYGFLSIATTESGRKRIRHVQKVFSNYLANPTGIIEYEMDDPDGLWQKWFLFRYLDTVDGEPCQREGCHEDRVRYGVFCLSHHFEMLFDHPPPKAK